jgi:hypothetical protein
MEHGKSLELDAAVTELVARDAKILEDPEQ